MRNQGIPKSAQKKLTIGLSLHSWKNNDEKITKVLKKLLKEISGNKKIRIVLLPHHISYSNDPDDISYMQELVSSFSQSTEIIVPDLNRKKQSSLAAYVKKMTSQVDVLLATRYHGLIFALSENVPVLAVNFDKYYETKNNGALELFFGRRAHLYQASLYLPNAEKEITTKMSLIIKNLHKEKSNLTHINGTLNDRFHTLQSLMSEFEMLQ